MGVMLYSTGCADYDEDITALSDKIDQLISGEIQPLKADLAKVKTDLEAAIAAAKAELKDIHEKDVKALQEADAALDAKLATANEKILALEGDITALKAEDKKLGDKLSALEGKMTEAEKAIDEANKAIDAVEDRATKLEAADKEFAEELKTIKADIKKLNEDLSKAVENLQKQITENTDDLATLDETVKGISTKVGEHLAAYAKFEAATNSKIAAIEGQIKDINDAIETIDGTLEDLQKQIDDNDADIEDIYTQIDLLVKADAAMNKAIGTLETDLSTLKANLKTELEKAFGDVYDEIEAVDADLYDFKLKMKAELTGAALAMEKLQKALEAEEANRIAKDNQLSSSLENLQKELKDQVAALNLRADAIEKAYKAADEQLQKNLEAAVETLNDAIAAAIDESKAYTDEEIKTLKAQLTDQHKKDIQAVADRMNDVRNELVAEFEKVREEMAAMYADLNKAINCLNKSVEEIKADIAAILARVQSVVYVPEYSDGKATVMWAAVLGERNEQSNMREFKVLPATSHIDFQIYPAECADALAEAWNNAEEDLKSFLTFDWTGVQVRSGEEVSFDIEAVEANEDGELRIYYKALNLASDFYSVGIQVVDMTGDPVNGVDPMKQAYKYVQLPMTQSYSLSLVIDDETANISSSYVNLICSTPTEVLTPRLFVNGDDCSEAVTEITDNSYPTFTIPYTDRVAYNVVFTDDEDGIADGVATTHKYLMPEVVFTNNADDVYSWTDLKDKGYAIERPDFKFWSVFAEETDADYFNRFVQLTNGKLNINLPGAFPEDKWLWATAGQGIQVGSDFNFATLAALTDAANAESVGTMMALNIAYDVMGYELSTGEIIKIGKAVGEAAGTVADIKWTYVEDADVDHNIIAKTDVNMTYYRNGLPVTIDEDNANLHDFAGKYSEFIDSAVEATVAEVAEDGKETEVEGVVATLAADEEENVTLNIDGFEFDKTYKLTFVYELDVIDITVEILVNTLDRNREKVTLNADDEVVLYKNIKFAAEKRAEGDETAPADMIIDVYTDIASRLNGIYPEADVYNEDVFVTKPAFAETSTITVWGFGSENEAGDVTKTIEESWKTNFVLDGGVLEAYVGFAYSSFDFAVEKAKYVKNITLWYGQEIELVYDVTFVVPSNYDFKHNDLWVYDTNGYFSQVKPRYRGLTASRYEVDTDTRLLYDFSVEDVDMDTAFDVVDTAADADEPLTDEQLAELGITTKFFFVEEPEDANIKFVPGTNAIAYNGKDESVHVAGKLMMSHSNGASFELPTSFDEGGIYAGYIVKKFNPLCDLSINPNAPKKIEVTEAKVYTVKAIDYFDLFESRDGSGTPYVWADGFKVNLIDHETKTWMIGNGKPSSVETSNGWYNTRNREQVYKMTSEFSLGAEIPAQYKNNITWIPEEGIISFDASKNIELTKDVVIPVKLSVDLPWAYTEKTVEITFGPKAGTVVTPEETPAE